MKTLEVEAFLELARQNNAVVFDVRTPAEFEKGRIPCAVNLPLLSNSERVVVGTTYKQQGRHPAILAGLDFVGPRMRSLVETVSSHVGAPGDADDVLLHCWRGGMRSASLAWLLELYGYAVTTLVGGYKSFRHWALAQIEAPPPFLVLGGYTGGGKSEVLWELEQLGEPVVDLEGLANHRGSAFGGLDMPAQPTQEHFENLMGWAFAETRRSGRAVWIEDEGRMVGRRHLPNSVLDASRASPVLVLEVDLDVRLDRLMRMYGAAPVERLGECFSRIRKRLGNQRADQALAALSEGDMRKAARIAMAYYDTCYQYGINRRDPEKVFHWRPELSLPADIARAAIHKGRSSGLT